MLPQNEVTGRRPRSREPAWWFPPPFAAPLELGPCQGRVANSCSTLGLVLTGRDFNNSPDLFRSGGQGLEEMGAQVVNPSTSKGTFEIYFEKSSQWTPSTCVSDGRKHLCVTNASCLGGSV